MLVLLSRSQQLLDVLGDLLRFADDVLRAGKRRVRLHLQVIQLWDGAALPQPATAPQPPPPEQTSNGKKRFYSRGKSIELQKYIFLNCLGVRVTVVYILSLLM